MNKVVRGWSDESEDAASEGKSLIYREDLSNKHKGASVGHKDLGHKDKQLSR